MAEVLEIHNTRRWQLRQPFWLAAGMGSATLCSGYCAFLIVSLLAGSGSLTINDNVLPIPIALIIYLSVGGFGALIALAIRYERAWSRPLILLFWVDLAGILTATLATELGLNLALLASVWLPWLGLMSSYFYLYQTPAVTAYFDELEARK